MFTARPGRVLAGSTLSLALLAGCPDRRLEEARALAADGESGEAGKLFLALAREDPASLAAWDGAVEASCRRETDVGRCLEVLDLELQLLGTLARHHDALAEVLERRALARLEQGLTGAARADLERAERAAPDRAGVLVARARLEMSLGRREAALEALSRARRLDPAHEGAAALLRELPEEGPDARRAEERFGGE